jgi:hypothetical protein
MGYIIKNTSGLINTQITDTGRKYLSQGNFNIAYFQVGDSEVCYTGGSTIQDGYVFEANYNAQNSTGFPQSNREYIKYPYYLEGTSGNTYGIPTDLSAEVLIFNYTDMLGFFVSGASNSYSANTNSAMTISANYTFSSSTLTGGYTITLDENVCSPSSGTPSVGDFITLYFDFTYPCGSINNYMILTYEIQSFSAISVSSYTVTLDRTVPDYSTITGCTGEGRAFIYPSGMTPFYDVTTPQNYFALPCATTPQVNIWNMNIPWSESPAGLIETSYQGYTYFGSINYIGSKEYLGYQTDGGQYFVDSSGVTATTDTFYFNSLGDRIDVKPSEQKAIAIVSYTNQSINNYYGEKFAVEPFDPSNPGQEGQARNLKVVLPTLMWHKSTGGTIGETFYIDPPGFDLLSPSYMESTKNSDFNTPGMRYYHLWDTNANANGIPNRVGKVYPDSKIVVFDDEEIIVAMSYKSNRNWTLPAPQLYLLAPNLCTAQVDSVGILNNNSQTMYLTYRFDSTAYTQSLHCNYYSKIEGPSGTTQAMNVALRFGNEFPFLSDTCYGFHANSMKIIVQVVTTGSKPLPNGWTEIDVTSDLAGTLVNGYIVQSGITNTTFVISLNDFTGGTRYNLANYINLPTLGTNNGLNFGDEYYFYGNFITDIEATIYEMKYGINLSDQQFTNTSNPTSTGTTNNYLTEIGLYNLQKELMILSKLQYPVSRQGLQQFLVKYDF